MSMDIENISSKKVFVVLGMSRNGTSAIARSLKALGVNLGDKLLPADSRNPKGFYEDSDILYKINRGVASTLGKPWMSVGLLDEKQIIENDILNDYKDHAITLLQQRLASNHYWGFKDPRTASILPFWQSVFNTLALDDRYIIVMRNPLASAYSNQKFAGMDIEMALLLWLITLISAVDGTKDKKRVLICYELMLQDPYLQLERMHKLLAINTPLDKHDANVYANEFLDKKLMHHECSDESLKTHSALAIAPLCLQVYEILMKVAKDEITFEGEAFQSAWQKIKAEFTKTYPAYEFIRRLSKQKKELEREIRTIRKSVSWKLLYPLRCVENVLRTRLRISKEKRRLLKGNA
jgi:hypothetical protein